MLSERHDNNSIFHWLCKWKRDGAQTPKEVICDQSLAILSAIVRAFAEQPSLEEYIRICYDAISDPNTTLPKCFLRCDVAHTIKMIASWDSLRKPNCSNRTRNLYIRGMAQDLQSTSLEDVKSLLRSLFIVAYSETEGNDINTRNVTSCEVEKTKLKNRIAFGNPTLDSESDNIILSILNTESEDRNASLTNHTFETESCPEAQTDNFEAMAKQIAHLCKLEVSTQEGDHDNLQFLPVIVSDIIHLSKLLPLWSGVMQPIFGYGEIVASSSPIECSFNDLKNRVFRHKTLPLRLDDFLEIHIRSLEGTMKLVAAAVKRADNEPSRTESSTNTDFPLQEDEQTVTMQDDVGIECLACINRHFPTGAHKCIMCEKAVHLLQPCSMPIENQNEINDEGYGQRRICMQCYKSRRSEPSSVSADDNSVNQEHLKENALLREDAARENWGGLILPLKKRSRTSYLEPQTEIANIDFRNSSKAIRIGILRNGNLSKKSIVVNKKPFVVSNTCAFDSLVQILSSTYCDSPTYKTFVMGQKHPKLLWEIVVSLVISGVNVWTYVKRAKLLLTIFKPTSLPRGVMHLAVESTATDMATRLLANCPTATDSYSCSNLTCTATRTVDRVVICVESANTNLKTLSTALEKSVSEIQRVCHNVQNENTPGYCGGIMRRTTTVSPFHLIIETLRIPEADTTADTNVAQELNCSLSDIPISLNLSGTIYTLRGTIVFSGGLKSASVIGHYTACCRRLGEQWEIYDDLQD